MPKYRCHGVVVGSKYLGVFEANSAEEAKEKALESEKAWVSVCHHCAQEVSDPEITQISAESVNESEKGGGGDAN